MSKKVLVTSALPYGNGPLHFGHLAGVYLPADVFTRHHRLMAKNPVLHICGSDEHGVAIMLNADKAKKDYQQYVDQWHQEHKKVFEDFQVDFDFFGQTSADYHAEEVKLWFEALYGQGLIAPKITEQLQCQDCHNHLPDRYVEGTCYECGYEKARGDECPNCGIMIDPIRLKKPVCQICGSQNIKVVEVTQYYLLLSRFKDQFDQWLEGKEKVWRKTVYPFVKALCKDELHDRAITRDLSWGIDVPLSEAKGKKLYVWFDAPIGYVSNTKQCLKQRGSKEDYLKDWWQNSETEITHFIGKDNIIFHCVIFPCMSLASGRANAAYDVPANQYLNLAGKQFSKSQGHTIDAQKAVDFFGSDALRYYLLAILPETSDSSFTWENFMARVNGELANNIGNLVSRCLKFWYKRWPEGIEAENFASFFEGEFLDQLKAALLEQHQLIEKKQIRRALEKAMHTGQLINTHFTDQAPWVSFKEDPARAKKSIAETSLMILTLGAMLEPFMPELSAKIWAPFSFLPKELKAKLYRGQFSELKDEFSKGAIALSCPPENLVPKIDEKVLASFDEKALEQTAKDV